MPVLRMDADLGDVSAAGADARAQNQGDGFSPNAVHNHIRSLRGKDAAAGKANDILQEPLRAMHGPVLVVDPAVGMIAVGFANEPRSRRQIRLAPRTKLEVRRQIRLSWLGTVL